MGLCGKLRESPLQLPRQVLMRKMVRFIAPYIVDTLQHNHIARTAAGQNIPIEAGQRI